MFSPHLPAHAESRLLEFIAAQVSDAGVPTLQIWPTTLNVFFSLITAIRNDRDQHTPLRSEAEREGEYLAVQQFLRGHEEDYPVSLALLQQRMMNGDGYFENLLELLIGGIEKQAGATSQV